MNFNSSQFEKTGVSFCKYILPYNIFSMIYVIWGVRDSFKAVPFQMVWRRGVRRIFLIPLPSTDIFWWSHFPCHSISYPEEIYECVNCKGWVESEQDLE